jgi:hypothetical protein
MTQKIIRVKMLELLLEGYKARETFEFIYCIYFYLRSIQVVREERNA